MEAIDKTIRQVLADHGRLPFDFTTFGDDTDLYKAGMSSHATVNIMVALEEELDVEFPEDMLRKSTFQSVAAIRAALVELTAHPQR